MPSPDISRRDDPVGPLRDRFIVDLTSADYENAQGFLCQAVQAGDLEVLTLEGRADQTITLAAGDLVAIGAFPVLLRAVRMNATVTNIVVGVL